VEEVKSRGLQWEKLVTVSETDGLRRADESRGVVGNVRSRGSR